MTRNRARKDLVRKRSAKTGESYTAALRQLLASKEIPMSTTPSPETPDRSCTMCGDTHSDSKVLLYAGSAPMCRECDERFRSVFRNHLAPIAETASAPLDQFMSTIAYESKDDTLVVHLHTFRPGLVIGHRGATVRALHADLLEIVGARRLQVNLVEHQGRGCKSGAEPAPPLSAGAGSS